MHILVLHLLWDDRKISADRFWKRIHLKTFFRVRPFEHAEPYRISVNSGNGPFEDADVIQIKDRERVFLSHAQMTVQGNVFFVSVLAYSSVLTWTGEDAAKPLARTWNL